MCRVVDDMTGDPTRIDGSSVERHGEDPIVGRKFSSLLPQRAGLIANAIQSRFNINLSRPGTEVDRPVAEGISPGKLSSMIRSEWYRGRSNIWERPRFAVRTS